MPTRLLVLGPDNSGKTAIVVRHLTKRFIGLYQSGANILYKHSLLIQDSWIDVEILDSSAFEHRGFTGLGGCIAWADCYLLVYDATHLNSAQRCRLFLEMIARVREDGSVPVVMLGNKTDLTHQAQVDKSEMADLANEFKCKHFMSSAGSLEETKVLNMVFLGLIAEAHFTQLAKHGISAVSKAKTKASSAQAQAGKKVHKRQTAATYNVLLDADLQALKPSTSLDRYTDESALK